MGRGRVLGRALRMGGTQKWARWGAGWGAAWVLGEALRRAMGRALGSTDLEASKLLSWSTWEPRKFQGGEGDQKEPLGVSR